MLKEIPQAPPVLEGSAYLDEQWRSAMMVLKNGKEIRGVRLRYDLLNELFEVQYEDLFRSVVPDSFQEVRVYSDPSSTSLYATYEPFRRYDRTKQGLAKTLYTNDSIRIIERPYVEVKEPTYVPTHHVGSRNKQIVQKRALYVFRGGKLVRFNRTKKSLAELIEMDLKDFKGLLKKENIDLDNDEELIRLLSAHI
ncbi:MAG: hypothetical protein AAGA85_00490 [Bacteroidota bacterium]